MTMIEMELTDRERLMLRCGVKEWVGPAAVTDELALAMGFTDREDLHSQTGRLFDAVRSASPLVAFDWARILVMTEFVFTSDVFGSGTDWPITTGIPDAESIEILRVLQRKFAKAGIGRRQFKPTIHDEYWWHFSAASAIRVYKHGRSDLSGLADAMAETIKSFGEDLAALEQLATKLAEFEELPESEQRTAVMAELDETETAFEERPGRRCRMFFI